MRYSFLWIATMILASCSDQVSELTVDQGYDFYPLKYGQIRTYQVREITYSSGQPDTADYYLKESIADSLVSEAGDITYVLMRYTSEDAVFTKEADSVWTVRKTENQIILSENNVPFVKLTFPVRAGATWNGNASSTRPVQNYYYEEITDLTVLDSPVDRANAIRVVIEDIPENLVNQDERSEIYVRGIGLVEKNYITLRFDSGSGNIGEVLDGRMLSQRLIGYE